MKHQMRGATQAQQGMTLQITLIEFSWGHHDFTPSFWASFHPHPLFEWGLPSNEILLNLGMNCWNSALNAQGSRVIIVVGQVAEVKIYVTGVEGLMEEGVKTGWNSVYHQKKIGAFLSCPPPLMLMYFFAGCFWISPGFGPNSGCWCCVFLPKTLIA
jgi:hypothetical protein